MNRSRLATPWLPAVAEAFARAPAVLPGAVPAEDVLSWEDVGRLVNQTRLSCNLVLADERLEDVSLDQVHEGLRQGATLQIEDVASHCPSVARAAALLSSALGDESVHVNLYASPAGGAAAFGAHHDPHDLCVVQVGGRKRWRVFERRVENPLVGYPGFDYSAQPPPCVLDAVLAPGDALVLRRGDPHDVSPAEDEPSLHLGFRVVRLTGAAVLKELVDRALARPELREAWPASPSGVGPTGERIQWVRHVLDLVAETIGGLDPVEVLAACLDGRAVTALPPVQFPDALRSQRRSQD